jgi:hypothetical protein
MKYPPDYLTEVKRIVGTQNQCDCRHVQTVPVEEMFRGEVAWSGEVEVFELVGHPKAKRAYAWGSYPDPQNRLKMDVTVVLEIPPVDSPQMAVKVAIAAHARKVSPPR